MAALWGVGWVTSCKVIECHVISGLPWLACQIFRQSCNVGIAVGRSDAVHDRLYACFVTIGGQCRNQVFLLLTPDSWRHQVNAQTLRTMASGAHLIGGIRRLLGRFRRWAAFDQLVTSCGKHQHQHADRYKATTDRRSSLRLLIMVFSPRCLRSRRRDRPNFDPTSFRPPHS